MTPQQESIWEESTRTPRGPKVGRVWKPRGPGRQSAHCRVEFGHTQAAQHVPLVADGPECDTGPTRVSAQALRDDGHVPKGDWGHLQPGPTGHQLAFSAWWKRAPPCDPRVTVSLRPPALGTRKAVHGGSQTAPCSLPPSLGSPQPSRISGPYPHPSTKVGSAI